MTPKNKNTGRSASSTRRYYNWGHTHIIIFLLIICTAVTLFIGTSLAWFISLDFPDIRSFQDYKPLISTKILDKNNKFIGSIYRENREVITPDKITPFMAQAFIAAEDSRYWDHIGLDIWSIARAFINNIRSGRRGQGGSTITQQVTRSLMLTRKKTYFRKMTEIILAYRLDRMLTKKEILTIYLNEIYFGEGAYGLEAAAHLYFSKKAKELSLAEIALLAGLPQAPRRYSPVDHFHKAKSRQRYVLNRMVEDGYISGQQAREAYKEKLSINPVQEHKAQNGYFTEYVRIQLKTRYSNQDIYRDGLIVSTSLDSKLQDLAARALQQGMKKIQERQKKTKPPQGGIVALDTASGRILAMVGGRDFISSQYNRVVYSKRQAGSTFKPIIYAAAFEKGYSPETLIMDKPFAVRNNDGSKWKPENNDKKYYGPTTLRDGLVFSRNIVTIKLLQKTGIKPVIKLAKTMGIHSSLEPELTLALGASNVSLLEITAAYTTFANNGIYHDPVCITSVKDKNGRVKPWQQAKPRRALSSKTSELINSLLSEVITRGTGQKAKGVRNAAGKTGTTDNNMDAWFIGYNDEITTGIWFGYDKGQPLGKGESGGRSAAPVWQAFMGKATK